MTQQERTINRNPYMNEERAERVSSGAYMAVVAVLLWFVALPALVWLKS